MAERARLADMPDWPRLMSRDAAAAYCGGVSIGFFEQHCPVKPMRLGGRRLYDRHALDRWLDSQSGLQQPVTSNDDWLGALDGDPGEGR